MLSSNFKMEISFPSLWGRINGTSAIKTSPVKLCPPAWNIILVIYLACLINIAKADQTGTFLDACASGNLSTVNSLISSDDFDPNITRNQGAYEALTGLALAAKNGHIAVVKQLLDLEKIDVKPQPS